MHAFKQETKNPRKKGPLAAIAAVIQKNPALAGGSSGLLVAMLIITANAVWYQPEKHPSPMFSTRTAAKATTVRTASANKQGAARVVSTALPARAAPAKSDELTKEIQSALAEKGLYTGSIDGIYGSRTRAAIRQYQQEQHIRQTGIVSAKLLSHILLSGKAIERVPVPKSQVAFSQDETPKGDHQLERKLVSAIQSGLKNYGYDDIVIDGVMGSQTSQAIRRFELDYGLQITGEPSKTLLKKLKDIGVINHG